MNITCVICDDQLQWHSNIHATPCGQVFHHACILRWLDEGSNTCPRCGQRATKQTIIKLHFTQVDTQAVSNNVASLQDKIRSLQLQLRVTETEAITYKVKFFKARSQCVALRGKVSELEKSARDHVTAVLAFNEQIEHFRGRSKYQDNLAMEVFELKAKLMALEDAENKINLLQAQLSDKLEIIKGYERLSSKSESLYQKIQSQVAKLEEVVQPQTLNLIE